MDQRNDFVDTGSCMSPTTPEHMDCPDTPRENMTITKNDEENIWECLHHTTNHRVINSGNEVINTDYEVINSGYEVIDNFHEVINNGHEMKTDVTDEAVKVTKKKKRKRNKVETAECSTQTEDESVNKNEKKAAMNCEIETQTDNTKCEKKKSKKAGREEKNNIYDKLNMIIEKIESRQNGNEVAG